MSYQKFRGWVRALTVAATAATMVGVAPVSAHAETTLLPGWDLPATVSTQADGSILAEVDPAALAAKSTTFTTLATTGCGSTCDGKDPNNYKYAGATCAADATTVRAVYEPGGTYAGVELRYSPRCRTAWARWSNNAQLLSSISLYNYTSSGTERLHYILDGLDRASQAWGPMVNDAGYLSKACYFYYDGGSTANPYYTICTTKY
ncbi:DUF2690 domain-containing protein [Actinoplanes sp. NPDC020271]|uniref:DUF2690 domain-containing protein n=1 Tax=Actinoplanes sp. NPDC020271 TaxID=3363896 RepID=UPI00379C55F6